MTLLPSRPAPKGGSPATEPISNAASGASGRIARWSASLILVYLMLRPVSNGAVLYPLLALLAVVSGAVWISRRAQVQPRVLGVLGLVLLCAIYGTATGVDNPGIEQHGVVWILGPLVFGMWAVAADLRTVRALMTASAWATIVLSAVIVAYILGELGAPAVVPAWIIEESGAGFDIDDGATAIRLYGLSTLTAAAPMWITGALIRDAPLLPRRSVRVLAGALALTAALLAGRNAVVVVVAVVPAVAILIARLTRRGKMRIRPTVFVLGTTFLLCLPILFSWVLSIPGVQRALANVGSVFTDGESNLRAEQSRELLDAWSRSPLFGEGLGAVLPNGYKRSIERPWNFELQYHLMAYQFGLIGIVILLLALGLAVSAVSESARLHPELRSTLTVSCAAAVGMLIANATNPYLQAPGHMWAIWLPLLVSNALFCHQRSESKSRCDPSTIGGPSARRGTIS